jgi:uncharacterized membrane protein YecN with MAPEG domain
LISGTYVAVLGLAISALSFYVSVQRGKLKIWFDDGGNNTLARARRAHYTVFEFGVIFLVLLVTYELLGGAKSWIHPLGLSFLAARAAHAFAALFLGEVSAARGLGMSISHVCSIILAVRILLLLL